MTNKTSVGLMGGTFDPIHFGHLAAAEEACFRFRLGEVVFIPAGRPPHKEDRQLTDQEHRFEMTRLALADNSHFSVSRIEIDNPDLSYTIDTIYALKAAHPEVAQYYFITGADAVLDILSWKQPLHLARQCHIIAATRPGYDLATFRSKVGEQLANLIEILPVPGVSVSSTEIRRRIKDDAPVRYLLPDSVIDYIAAHRLYR